MSGTFVLVHGAWHGPWCWENITPELRAAGHEVVEVELPDHDAPGTFPRNWSTIGSYMKAVDDAVSRCSEPPILAGHSMGGYVVQRCLESLNSSRVRSGVLVASATLHGVLEANLRILRTHPWPALRSAFTLSYAPLVATTDQVRAHFFTSDTPQEIVGNTAARLQNESSLAINRMLVRWPKPSRITVPIHVIAAELDPIFSVPDQHKLAAAYDAPITVIEGAGHDLMLDTQWPQLGEALLRIGAT